MASRFQFPLRNLFIATAWMALWGSLFPLTKLLESNHPWPYGLVAFSVHLFHLFLFFCLPFVAIGALLGNTKTGCLIGGVVGVLVVVGLWVLIVLV